MVREARFVHPTHALDLRNAVGDGDLLDHVDELYDEIEGHAKPSPRQETPVDKSQDRRHLAGADWIPDARFLSEE